MIVCDTCAVLEVALSSHVIRQRHEVITVGFEDQTFTSMEGLMLRPHMLLEDVHPDTIHAFIILFQVGRPWTMTLSRMAT